MHSPNLAPLRHHQKDNAAVDDFVHAMKAKLAAARNMGREGWQQCSGEDLSRMLREHVEKGDPVDVANLCMFLHHLGLKISPADVRITND